MSTKAKCGTVRNGMYVIEVQNAFGLKSSDLPTTL